MDYVVVVSTGEISGGDTVIARVPDQIRFFLDLVPGAMVIGGPIPAWLALLGHQMAAAVESRFARGEFKFTNDPEVVRTFGIMEEHQGCADCEAGVKLALEALAEDPDELLVVGQLHWEA